jgi:hypothetical protein
MMVARYTRRLTTRRSAAVQTSKSNMPENQTCRKIKHAGKSNMLDGSKAFRFHEPNHIESASYNLCLMEQLCQGWQLSNISRSPCHLRRSVRSKN